MRLRHPIALLLGVLVAVAIGCGDSSGTIPRGKTATIIDHLNSVKATLADKKCSELSGKVSALKSDITNLQSAGVPAELVRNLRDGVAQLSTAAQSDCEAATTQTVPTDTTPTEPVQTDTVPTDTEPTDTGPTDTGPTDTGPVDTGPGTTVPPPVTAPDTGGASPEDPTGQAGP